MTDLKDRGVKELRDDWLDTIQLREKVLAWAKHTGYNANDLVSRTAEHDIERYYGKKRLDEGT